DEEVSLGWVYSRSERGALGALEKAQRHHHGHFAARKRQRPQRLAGGGRAERRSILRSDTNRVLALLRYRRVVDHQHRIAAADKLVGLAEPFTLHRGPTP